MINDFLKATKYVQDLNVFDNELLDEFEKEALENNIPIITRDVLKFLLFTADNISASNILEIGTAVGYSGVFLAEISRKYKGKLTTIEIDEDRYIKAKQNFSKFNLADNVEQILGDVLKVLPELVSDNRKYDLIFIDASKSKYIDFFNLSYGMLNKGGYIFIDNLMFRGLVAENEFPKKYRTILNNLDKFINYLNEEYNFVLLPFGDGVGLVYKK